MSRILLLLPLLLLSPAVAAQNALTAAVKGTQEYRAEASVQVGAGAAPLWMMSNRYGTGSERADFGYLRASLRHDADADSTRRWRIGYGADAKVSYNHTSSPVLLQQLYADFDFRLVRISVGAKERPMQMKHNELSSGAQTFGRNARPVPEVRFEMPHYWNISKRLDLLAIKGHFGYGLLTDGKFQEHHTTPGHQYATSALYHSRAGYLRIGNPKKFPLVFEGGLEMACVFGGTIHNFIGNEYVDQNTDIKMPHGARAFFDAFIGIGGDQADGEKYANATGNTLGSWNISLGWLGKKGGVRAYYDHFFEDHSQMFFEYGWKDGLWGVEITFPKNPVATTLVYEHLRTDDQSGAVYHDWTDDVADQISGRDNYYNHGLYAGWQHHGLAIGNALYVSPLYRHDGSLDFDGNRFRAHHFGLSGDPLPTLHYRVLYSYQANRGTYQNPYKTTRYLNAFLVEARWSPERLGRLNTKGWSLQAAVGLDRGSLTGNNTAFSLTLAKCGLF